MARHYLRDCMSKLRLYYHKQSTEKVQIIRFVNTKSRYKTETKRTIIIVFEVEKIKQMKQQKQNNEKQENNLWNAIHYWCNCNHVMIVMFLLYCIQNDIKIQESDNDEKLLQAIDLGIVYKNGL